MLIEQIYHYTSIETLALILETRRFKFSALSKVNDLEEGLTSDIGDLRKYIFVSCWTRKKKESIRLWQEYTNMKGVRIELPYPVFNTYTIGKYTSILFDEEDSSKEENNYVIFPNRESILQIEYTNDKNRIKPDVHFLNDESEGIALYKLAKYKETKWSYEKELRFYFTILPTDGHYLIEFEKLINNKPDIGFDDYFLSLKKDSFKKMKIRMGPKTTERDKIIVEALIKDFNSTAIIESS